MHAFFEDDGTFKAGTILADNDASLHIEGSTGKRLKVKAAQVLLRFAAPAPAALLAEAQALANTLEADFLWEVCGENEFAAAEFASDYFGHAPTPVEAAAVVYCLHSAPAHFYRKGKGRYKAAPQAALAAAKAGFEKKRLEAEKVSGWVASLARRELPESMRAAVPSLLYGPDKGSLEYKALSQACEATRLSPLKLLMECGALRSTHDYHFQRFLFEFFPRGTAFGSYDTPRLPEGLPVAQVDAFSIDDASTTEIDDAFSVTRLERGQVRVGIHIAAPALGIEHGSPLDAIARARLSTVYMPGCKITMLPEEVVERYSLAAGCEVPALSMYLTLDAEGRILGEHSAVECLTVTSNLRHEDLEHSFAGGEPAPGQAHGADLALLHALALRLEAARGKEEVARIDYNFAISKPNPEDDSGWRITITPRLRGSPLDKLVAELMIHVNASWGKLLADSGLPGLYRTQGGGKVKMSTQPLPHQGLGLAQYLWASSPLRRYADLANQRQLIALLQRREAPYAQNDAELFAAMTDFELTYGHYADFQNRMEHYWCLRWILQEQCSELIGSVIRDNLVRADTLPLYLRVPDLPTLAAGSRVRLGLGEVDLIAASVETRYLGPPI
jgi:exoribonuclease-2